MSKQDGAPFSTQQSRSRTTSTTIQKNGKLVPAVQQRPTHDDKRAWYEYWKAKGQEWRHEPEIDPDRQRYLFERLCTKRDFVQGIFPFKGIKLDRADIEWLLATHEDGSKPVDWQDKSQHNCEVLDLYGVDLCDVDLMVLPLGGVDLQAAHLEGADLGYSHLEGANLTVAHLEGARLEAAQMQLANLNIAHLEGANLIGAHLEGANLINAFFDSATRLDHVHFSNEKWGSAKFTDVHWGDVNLAVVDWSTLSVSGEESTERLLVDYREGLEVDYREGLEIAVRGYRQLSVVLRNQGLSEDAARFAYFAQFMQRKVFWHARKIGQYFGSLFLDLLTGYGYKPIRSFLAYLIVITMFATAYFIVGRTVGPALSPLGSFVFSMTSFHGRGFFPGGIGLDDPLTVFAAIEAFVGLLIEVTFIATLTQRLFGK